MSYIFYWSVNNSFSETEKLMSWAKRHCPSYITNDVENRADGWYYRLYFGEEKDYVFFTLMWG